jgi:Tol biopolymer transport system component
VIPKGRLLALVVIGAAVLCSCQMREAGTARRMLLRLLAPGSGLICYLAPGGNIRLIDPKSGRERALTDDAGRNADGAVVYAAPTWSPDGTLIAFARISLNGKSALTDASLYTVATDGKRLSHLLSGTRLQPFYLFWSPDSRRVSLLSQVRGENALELGIATAGAEGDYRSLDGGSPFYWDWLGDGRTVVAHVNGGRNGKADERLSVLNVDAASVRADVKVGGGFFQAPNISPDGRSFVYASSSPSGFTLHLRALDGSADRDIARGEGGTFFSLSGDGKRLAYLAAAATQPFPLGKLTIVDLAGRVIARTLEDSPVLAFFWAPDGRNLAYVVPETTGKIDPQFLRADDVPYVRLVGCDTATGKTWTIARFPPSGGMFSILPFFDQFQRSATIWSPDSRFILFTALTADGSPGLFIAKTDRSLPPRFLTSGDYAFWSWK